MNTNPTKNKSIAKAFKKAFPVSLPVMAGYVFLGLAYGIYMNVQGFSFVYPMLMALIIYGGSLEFIAVTLLLSPFAPLQALVMALVIQARHLFYGIAMLDRYKGMGWKKPYLIYALSDETFSVAYSAELDEDIDKGWFYFFVAALDQFYWVFGATMGGIIGDFIPFNTEGLDFVMTAMFMVIFLDAFLKEKQHISSIIGLGASVACLIIFGADNFMVPTMICVLVLLTLLRKPIEKKEEG